MLLAKLKHLSNRQDTKHAKNSIPTPRYALGDFEKALATFADLAVQKTTLKRGTIPFYDVHITLGEDHCVIFFAYAVSGNNEP